MLENVPGADEAKARLAGILASLSGERAIPEICRELGVRESRFHELGKEFLAGAVGLLERRAAGRKPALPEADPEISRLREENERLRLELEAERIRSGIALVMPHVLKPASREGKKKVRSRRP
jgi:hypothetical protein